MEILVALYPYDKPTSGLNAYALENKMVNKVDLTGELEELRDLGYIVEIPADYAKKNAKYYNITSQGRELVDFYRGLDNDPRGRKIMEWALRRKGLTNKFVPSDSVDDPKSHSTP